MAQAYKMYYSKRENLYACWHNGSKLLLIGHSAIHDDIDLNRIFYSNNAIVQYLKDHGYQQII